ncbi:MAG: hypothetical protein FWG52_06065 [Proteobacteria bacterium]|jgi:hypothetical protein|nr:hypothetical protein [Pseudomonadota bacterium]
MTCLALVVPGLIWPSPQAPHPAKDVPHAALARLLGRGRQRMEPAVSREHLLARLLGMESHPSLPLAALRLLGEENGSGHAQGDGKAHWLCADPVNLSFMGDHVLLDEFDGDEGEIDAAEAAALIAALNDEFADLGHFSATAPTRWYLRMECPTKAHFFSLDDVVCRPVRDFLPTGGEGDDRHWRHVLNEIQVALHNHPVNIARGADGRRLINSLWFWGNGAQSTFGTPDTPRFAVQAFDPVARGLARAAGIEPGAPDVNHSLRADTLVVLDTLASPIRHLDLARWQDALAALERDWFAPIARELDRGALRHFALYVPGERAGFSLTFGSGARWRFWRKPLSLSLVHCPPT